MDDPTCIVCLGDLATSPSAGTAAPSPGATSASTPDSAAAAATTTTIKTEDATGAIAHLLPCGHNLHNDCLQPWVERANSCPICRTSFNMVELMASLSGPTISSYGVQDKTQVAEVDASAIAYDDLFDDAPSQPCIMCDEHGDDGNLLLCDGCSNCCHTYCAGLSRVPAGLWFCQFCQQDDVPASRPEAPSRNRRPTTHQRTVAWNEVWSEVYTGANIDLDFPFASHQGTSPPNRTRRNGLRQWQRRFNHAEQLGAAARFRDTLASVIGPRARARARRTPTPSPESQEELQAWNALDKAQQLQDAVDASTNTRKRNRSAAPPSPAEPQVPASERQLKRPRQRRNQEPSDVTNDATNDIVGGPSRTVPIIAPRPIARPDEGPTFLQSLLDEVKTAPVVNGTGPAQSPDNGNAQTTNASCNTSPAGSPASSTPSSPRMRSISPSGQRSRPASPPPLTSRVEPGWYLSQFSPASPASPTSPVSKLPSNQTEKSPPSGNGFDSKCPSPPADECDCKRTILNKPMNSRDKKTIQAMVADQLRPLYNQARISSDQFTDINRSVSRLMYELVQKSGGLKAACEDERERWRDVVATEVDKAFKALKEEETTA